MIDNASPQSGDVGEQPKTKIENTTSHATHQVEGLITKQIGSGEYAKDTFIYITIFWSFVIGSVTCGAIYIRTFAPPEMTAAEIVEMVKGVWSIFLPIITLALGYSFGKGR
ncbi:hypothetical protein HX793_30635 [Pseudomonas reactans]|uniref:hypothetical protein n=1 Tax=Pseudomonas reactans TaxID=117680 RepID=UPI0015BDB536|nr:hypothetical protein [Pseudomonas reactans]NWD34159.1 hypothetical protein [Pseudomonas reactans]